MPRAVMTSPQRNRLISSFPAVAMGVVWFMVVALSAARVPELPAAALPSSKPPVQRKNLRLP
jgi:hypothetical protein